MKENDTEALKLRCLELAATVPHCNVETMAIKMYRFVTGLTESTTKDSYGSYSDSNPYFKLAQEFMNWQRKWNLFDKQDSLHKPPHLDEFLADVESRYFVDFKTLK